MMTNENTSNEKFNDYVLDLDAFSGVDSDYSIGKKNNTLKPNLLKRKSVRPNVSLKKLSLRPSGSGVRPRVKKKTNQHQSFEN